MSPPLSISNARPTRVPGPDLLHSLVATSGDQSNTAIDYSSSEGSRERLSYEALHARADAVAQAISSSLDHPTGKGGSRGVIPVYVPQSPELYVSQLAILKAGAAFCPIALDAPRERLRFIAQDVDAKVLLTTTQASVNLPELNGVVVITVDEWAKKDGAASFTPPALASEAPAYVMYTSGSTGQPKGVVLSHSAATQALLSHDRYIPRFARFLQFASPTFDVSVFEIFFPFHRGATLVCGDRRELLTDLPGFINRMEIDAAELTPSVASSLLQGRHSVPNLRMLLTIGEMLKQDVVEDFGGSEEKPGILLGMYGPTEATIHCTLQPAFAKSMSVRNIGMPLDTVSAFVVKPQEEKAAPGGHVEILPMGEEGELAIGGFQLADGYLHRDEQTRAAFVHHEEHGRLYRTGDRAKLASNGILECLGRISQGQVKLRGQRIELGEIEHAASKTPGCRSVVADVLSGSLVVFCVGDSSSLTKVAIQKTCQKWLPSFMVPSEVLLLETLPYLPSGKADRKALQQIHTENRNLHGHGEESLSERTQEIIAVVSDVLGAQVSPNTTLAAAGLDSLSSIRLSSRLKRAGFPQPDATSLLETKTVRELEAALDTASHENMKDSAVSLDISQAPSMRSLVASHQGEVADLFFATQVQSAMLSETLQDPQAYCNSIELAVSGHSDVNHLRAGIYELARHHALLRSGFIATGERDAAFGTVVWNELLPEQIREVDDFSETFEIQTEADMLRPCSFQLRRDADSTHVLILIHHSLYDQWSIDVFRRDLMVILQGNSPGPPPSFRAVSQHQQETLATARSETTLQFWSDHLQSYVRTPLPLMNGKAQPRALRRSAWQDLAVELPSLRDKSLSLGVSAPVVFQIAMTCLIGYYTGSTDVTYGVVYSGRHAPITGIESIFGPCLSTIPFRIDHATAHTCLDLLHSTQDLNRKLQKRSSTPLADIKKAANVDPHTPLFDILFVWQETSLGVMTSRDSKTCVREVDSRDRHEFNLVIEFEPWETGVRARATYQQALICGDQINLFFRQLIGLVKTMLERPESMIEELGTTSVPEDLSISNANPMFAAKDINLVAAIEHHAQVMPDQIALIFADSIAPSDSVTTSMTYQQLNEKANRLAHHLVSLCVKPNDLVYICMEKSLDLYVAILGTIKAGAGYLPLLPETPEGRVKSILQQVTVKVSICDPQGADMLRKLDAGEVVSLAEVDLERLPAHNLKTEAAGSDVAYIVFTSGTTGQPKGVAVTLDNLLSNLAALADIYPTKPGDRLLQACSQAFDVSVFEILFSMYAGICICSAGKETLFGDLEGSIRALKITHLSMTPTVAALVDPQNVPTVNFLVTAGEAMTDRVHRNWAGRGLNQGYGPSETTNICTVNMDMSRDDSIGNIGPPLRNTSAFVISPDPGFCLLPAGAIGEFAFGGEQVFRGYVGMDQLNEEKIIEHPKHGRVYRSGDLGRMLPDGTLLITGRIDDQIKIRGNRVELGEISANLLSHENVRDCTTILTDGEAAGTMLATFVVLEGRSSAASSSVSLDESAQSLVPGFFEGLEQSLPSYMVPSLIVPINRLPFTPQTKLDKRCLLQLLDELDAAVKTSLSRSGEEQEQDDGWTSLEKMIAETLAQTLGIKAAISRTSSLFAFGLNSLNAIAFAKSLQSRLQSPIGVGDILRNTSIARLSKCIDAQAPAGLEGVKPTLLDPDLIERVRQSSSLEASHINAVLPCTPLQEAMLSTGASTKDGSSKGAYCNLTIFDVAGDFSKLKRCWEEMVSRHSILRTRFVETDQPKNPYVQVVLNQITLPWQDHLDVDIYNSTHTKTVSISQPFRIDVCASFSKMALQMHHAVYDGISMSLLLHEVEHLYHSNELPPVASFEPFLAEVHAHAGSEAMNFWCSHIQGYQPKPFPKTDAIESSKEQSICQQLSISSSALDEFCQKYTVSHLAVFQAALAKTLAHCQAAQDVCFGNVVSGRSVSVEGVDRLVAPCFNTIPLRSELSKTRSTLDLVRSLNDFNAQSLSHQLTPLRHIRKLSADPSRHLFDALLILQPPSQPLDETIWRVERDQGAMDVPLVFEIELQDRLPKMNLHHQESSISTNLATEILQTFDSALSACLKRPLGNVNQLLSVDAPATSGALASKLSIHTTNVAHPENEPWTDEEQLVREGIATISGIESDRIRKDTTIYQTGLDSLNAAQLASWLRRHELHVDAADVLEAQTASALAVLAGRNRSNATKYSPTQVDLQAFDKHHRNAALQCLGIPSTSVQTFWPCTSVQAGMLAQSLQTRGRLYVNHVTYRVPKSTPLSTIERAWTSASERHPILRSGFHALEGEATPFAMVTYRNISASTHCFSVRSDSLPTTIEANAREAIMQDLISAPWRVSIQQSSEGMEGDLMTISIHHALYDADSLQLVLKDFRDALQGRTLGDGEMRFDRILRSTLAAEDLASREGAKFWTEALKDASVTKYPDLTPTVIEESSLQTTSCMSQMPVSIIENYCRNNGATLQAVGQSAWAMLLAAYTGDANVTFGTVFSGKADSNAWDIAFPSISTVPVPCNTEMVADKVVQAMVDFNGLAQRHRFLALSNIQRHGGHAGQALFDTVFVYQKSRTEVFDWAPVRETAAVEYAVSLEIEAGNSDQLAIRLTFDIARVPHEQADLLLRQYDHFLQTIVETTRGPLSDLHSILPASEPRLTSNVHLLHEFVEDGATSHPERVALEFMLEINDHAAVTKSWSYAKLNERGNQVAHLLHGKGALPGGIVAVCMDKSPEATFAFLGILKAGCAFLAMDPELPESRMEFIMKDSGAQVLFMDETQAPSCVKDVVTVVGLKESKISGLPSSSRKISVPADYNAYILYTSGTTGTPKGCELTHDNAVQAMLAFQRLFAGRWTPDSRWLQFASYWFDVSVLEQFWSWSAGITVVGAPRDLILEDLPEFIRRLQITHIDLTPSLAGLLQPDDVPTLWDGVFITGGEALKQDIIDAWGPKRIVCNGYGPTEATIGVTMNTFVGPDAKPSNIGRQFDNVGAFVLRPQTDEPVLRGAVGELCVSGPLVGKAYLNRPDLTSRGFPFLERFGEKVYRTGDLVRVLADGSFSFLGRADSQAKIRGQRLEIGEIDSAIQSVEQVAGVVSLVVKSGDGSKETLVSFLATGSQSRGRELRIDATDASRMTVKSATDVCRTRLPGYMVPTHILPVTFLPLTVNNKIDAKRLTALFTSASSKELQSLKEGFERSRPLNQEELQVCRVLSKALAAPLDDVTEHSNLFSLGLSSISAIAFSSLLKRAGFERASIAVVMNNPTIGKLSAALGTKDAVSSQNAGSVEQAKLSMAAFAQRYRSVAAQSLDIEPDAIEAVAPCTPLQQGLILESTRNAAKPYFNEFRYNLNGVSNERLHQALCLLCASAEVLRARFVTTDDGAIQVVFRHTELPFSTIEISSEKLEAAVQDSKDHWLAKNSQALVVPFEVCWMSMPGNDVLIVHIHHALYDGISFDLLMSRLWGIYRTGQQVQLGPSFIKSLPYGPLREASGAKDFWTRRLRDHHYVPLHTATPASTDKNSYCQFEIEDAMQLETKRKELGVSHQALMQACFELALSQNAPQTETYGVVVSGRSIELEGADQILGPMFNTLPQPLDVKSGSSLSDHIRHCHELNTATLPYQHTPLRDIRKWCASLPNKPMFDVLFVFQHTGSQSDGETDRFAEPLETAPAAEYPLAVEAEMRKNGIIGITLLAQGQVFGQASLQAFQDTFCKAVECLLRSNDTELQDLFDLRVNDKEAVSSKATDSEARTNGFHHVEWTGDAITIRQVIAELINVDQEEIEETTTLFALGLDSIDAVKLASRLRKRNLPIPVSRLLQAQTIPQILEAIDYQNEEEQPSSQQNKVDLTKEQLAKASIAASAVDDNDVEQILPATPNQEALIADMIQSNLEEYFNHDILRLQREVDLNNIKAAWQTVIDGSPILRTSFVEISDPSVDAVYAQIVHKPAPLRFHQFSAENTESFDGILANIRKDVQADIAGTPPLRLSIVTVRSDTYLILSLAHAQYDGHSLTLVHEDVQRSYQDRYELRPDQLTAIANALQATSDESQRFWSNALSGATAHRFPLRNPDEASTQVNRAETTSNLSADEARRFCQNHGVSMQAFGQTCWAIALAHFSRRLEVLFGVVLACRDTEEAERVLFPMMNTVVMRSALHGTRAQMLSYVQSMIAEMLPYQRTPLRMIKKAADGVNNGKGEQSTSDLFDTLFIFQHRPDIDEDAAKPLYHSIGGHSNVDYPVAIEIEVVANEIVVRAACKNTVLGAKGASTIVNCVETVMKSIVTHPEAPTVDIRAGAMSLSGMEPFQIESASATQPNGTPATNGYVTASDPDDDILLSPILAPIIGAFAKISDVAASDIQPSSTIESIGIDSISAIKVSGLLRKQAIKLTVSDILRSRSPAKMAQLVEQRAGQAAVVQPSPGDIVSRAVTGFDLAELANEAGVHAGEIQAVAPATAGQVYMLSMWRQTGGQLFYPTFSYRLDADVGLAEVEKAWGALVSRHSILRTVFFATGDEELPCLQVVLQNATPRFASGRTIAENKQGKHPMVSLAATSTESGFTLDLTIHHALYDAVSLPLLMQDLHTFITQNQAPTHLPKYEDFLAFSLSQQTKTSRSQFWPAYLEPSEPLTLPQPPQSGSQPRTEIFHPALVTRTSDLEHLARAQSLSLQSLIFAAIAKIYATLSMAKQEASTTSKDVILGIYLSNRGHLADLETLPFPTLNLVPLLVRTPQSGTLIAVAREIQKDLTEIGNAENTSVGLWEVAKWTGKSVDAFVNFLKLPDSDSRKEGKRLVEVEGDAMRARAEVVQPSGSGWQEPRELQRLKDTVGRAFKHSIDFEMAVGDGKLDLGLFGPEAVVGLDAGKSAVVELGGLLEGLL